MAENRPFKEKLKWFWAKVKKLAVAVGAYFKAAKLEWLLIVGLLALDLGTKALVEFCMMENQFQPIITKFLNIHFVYNPDAAFGAQFLRNLFGDGARIIFCIFAIAAVGVFIALLVRGKKGSKLYRVALAMLIAGALGNCYDRLFLGQVRDFIEFEYFGLTIFGRKTFFIFNIADAELVIGVVMFIIYFIFLYKDKHEIGEDDQSVDQAQLELSQSDQPDTEETELQSGTPAVDASSQAQLDLSQSNQHDTEATELQSEVADSVSAQSHIEISDSEPLATDAADGHGKAFSTAAVEADERPTETTEER